MSKNLEDNKMNKKQKRSELWNKLKQLGLNEGLVYKTTKSSEMLDKIAKYKREEQAKQNAIKYENKNKGKVPQTLNELFKRAKGAKFPLFIQYVNENGDLFQFSVSDQSKMNSIVDAIDGSDFLDKKVSKVVILEKGSNLKQLKKHKRSKKGQGDDFKQIQVVNSRDLYIPSSGNCLWKCIQQYLTEQLYEKEYIEQKHKQFLEICRKLKIIRDNIPQCKLRQISDYIEIEIVVYNELKRGVVKRAKQIDMIVYIYQQHYVWMKRSEQKIFESIGQQFKYIEAILQNEILETKVFAPKVQYVQNSRDLIDGVYIWDLEACVNHEKDGLFEQYACGIIELKRLFNVKSFELLQEQKLIQRKELVEIFIESEEEQKSSIERMVQYIDNNHSKIKVQIKNKTFLKKKDIYVYAHNAKGFDNLIVHQQQNLKFKSVIKKGSQILSLCVKGKNTNIHFRCTMAHLMGSLKKLCKDFKLSKELSKGEFTKHELITKDNFMQYKDEWEPYLINDVLSLALVWGKHLISTFGVIKKEDNSCIDIRQCITAPSMAFRVFLQYNEQELRQFVHPYVKQFVRKSIHGGRVCAYKREFRSKELMEQFGEQYENKIEELSEKYLEQKRQLIKYHEQQQIEIPVEQYVKSEMSKIIEQKKFKDLLMAFDATSLYPAAMKTIQNFPDLRSSFVIEDLSDFYKKLQKREVRNQYIIQCDINLPSELKFIPVPCKDKKGGCFYKTGDLCNQYYNNIDIDEIYRFGGKVTKVHQGIMFKDYIANPFNKFIDTFFELRKVYKKEGKDLLQNVVKLILNSCYGKTVQKDILQKTKYCSQKQFEKKYDQTIQEYTELENGQICFEQKMEECENSYPSILGCYILSQSKKIMNDFVIGSGSHLSGDVYYTDTDSLYIPIKLYETLNQQGFVGEELGQGKNDYGDGGIIFADFLGPKQKLCYTINNWGLIEKKVTFKGIEYAQQNEMDIEEFKKLKEQQDKYNNGEQIQLNKVTVSRWERKDGIKYKKDNMQKSISAIPQLQKMNLENGEYKLINEKRQIKSFKQIFEMYDDKRNMETELTEQMKEDAEQQYYGNQVQSDYQLNIVQQYKFNQIIKQKKQLWEQIQHEDELIEEIINKLEDVNDDNDSLFRIPKQLKSELKTKYGKHIYYKAEQQYFDQLQNMEEECENIYDW